MEQVKRKVEIQWKYNPSSFEIINKDVVGAIYKRIGGSKTAINSILEKTDMLQFLMPGIIGVSPNSKDVNWQKVITDYWNSLTVEVPDSGKVLEVGFAFSVKDATRVDYINELRTKLKSDKNPNPLKTDKELADYVMGFISGDTPNVLEEDRWKYGSPMNVEDYLLFRYIENYGDVANRIEDINKSQKIRFYMVTDGDKERKAKAINKAKSKALDAHKKFITNAKEEDYNDLLIIFKPNEVKDIVLHRDFDTKQTEIMDEMYLRPEKFVETISNKSLSTLAKVKKYEAFGIFRKLANSSTIVDASDPSIVIGNSDKEYVSFMSNDKNKQMLNEYEAKFKSLIK